MTPDPAAESARLARAVAELRAILGLHRDPPPPEAEEEAPPHG